MPTTPTRPSLVAAGCAVALHLAVLGLLPANTSFAEAGGTAALSGGATSLPLAFVPSPDGRFVTRTAYGSLSLAPGDVRIRLADGRHRPTDVRLSFEGASRRGSLQAGQRLAGSANYLIGDDPSRWRTDVPTYASVLYTGLYQGVDLRYDGGGSRLKGTYTVAPGTDPEIIRWRYSGAESLAIGPQGELLVSSGGWTVSESAPVAWQEIGGDRRAVAVSYRLLGDGGAGFSVGEYDRRRPLIIDPYLVYSTLVGGGKADEGWAIAVDGAGNTYVTGTTLSQDFPGSGAPQSGYGGESSGNFGDAFIMKLAPDGASLVYMTYVGGSASDGAAAIAVDGAGNAYITGVTWSDDFPTMNALQSSRGDDDCGSPPCSDAFVTKLNSAGNSLVFSTYLGGDREENAGLLDVGTRQVGLGIAVDSARNVYVTGRTFSTNFPVVNAAYPNLTGLTDIFLSKLRPDGTALTYSTYIGGSGAEYSGDVAADDAGNAYLTGATLSNDFPVVGAFQASTGSSGVADAVVVKINTTTVGAGAVVFSSYLGGDGADYGLGIEVAAGGAVSVAGHTTSTDFPTVNAFEDTNLAAEAGDPIPRMAFAARILANGSALSYSTYLGGSADDLAYSLDINASGHIFIAGRTNSDDLPVRQAWQTRRGASSTDVMVARINPFAVGDASLVYCTYAGANGTDLAYGIAVDGDDNAYVTGISSGVVAEGFPIGTVIGPNGSGTGVLVLKLGPRIQRWVLVGSRADGANGSIWRTALGLRNTGGATATVEVILHKVNTFSKTFSVPAGAQIILEDVVGQLGASGSGALEVLSDREIKLSSRTYNLIAAAADCFPMGTFGQNYDAIAATDALGDGQRAYLTQLVENDAYRTNIALTNTGPFTAHVQVRLFNGSGTFLSSYESDVPPGRWDQTNRPFLAKAKAGILDRGYAEIYVPSGFGVIASASVIDAITNDPTTITMLDKNLAAKSSSWFQVGSHANGAKGSRWRSDLGLLNATFTDATANIMLHSGGTVYSSSIEVAAGDQLILDDVVGQIPFTGSGALEVSSDQPLFTNSRTYNQISSGADCLPSGTLGQNYDSFPAGGGLANGETAWLPQLTENDSFRTNIAATNTGSGTAIVRVTLYGPGGGSLATFDITIPEGQWRQENRPFFSKAGRADLDAASAKVEVIQGSGVIVSASVVDNITNDPTTIAAIQ